MQDFNSKISVKIQDSVYIKNPESSDLGEKIIKGGIEILFELGFEDFTFKKLAKHISSTEASIYRYFESKHQLLSYLVCWYWGWTEYKLMFGIANLPSNEEMLKKAIEILTGPVQLDKSYSNIDEIKLNQIINRDFSKIYLNTHVDRDNAEGYFLPYKSVVARVSDIVMAINPKFEFPHMLITTIIEGAHHQRFFAEHLPRLTDVIIGEDAVTKFYNELVFKTIQ
jgi:AcrR family transcriptional regulator